MCRLLKKTCLPKSRLFKVAFNDKDVKYDTISKQTNNMDTLNRTYTSPKCQLFQVNAGNKITYI